MALHSAGKRFAPLLALLLFFAAPALRAGTLSWEWTYTSSVYQGSGTFTTSTVLTDNPEIGPSYTVTAITGTWDGEHITGIVSPGNLGANDNQLAILQPQLDSSGLDFATSDTDIWNIFNSISGSPVYGSLSYNGLADNFDGTFSASITSSSTSTSPAPEPSSIVLLGTALMALGGLIWRQKLNTAAITA